MDAHGSHGENSGTAFPPLKEIEPGTLSPPVRDANQCDIQTEERPKHFINRQLSHLVQNTDHGYVQCMSGISNF